MTALTVTASGLAQPGLHGLVAVLPSIPKLALGQSCLQLQERGKVSMLQGSPPADMCDHICYP